MVGFLLIGQTVLSRLRAAAARIFDSCIQSKYYVFSSNISGSFYLFLLQIMMSHLVWSQAGAGILDRCISGINIP